MRQCFAACAEVARSPDQKRLRDPTVIAAIALISGLRARKLEQIQSRLPAQKSIVADLRVAGIGENRIERFENIWSELVSVIRTSCRAHRQRQPIQLMAQCLFKLRSFQTTFFTTLPVAELLNFLLIGEIGTIDAPPQPVKLRLRFARLSDNRLLPIYNEYQGAPVRPL